MREKCRIDRTPEDKNGLIFLGGSANQACAYFAFLSAAFLFVAQPQALIEGTASLNMSVLYFVWCAFAFNVILVNRTTVRFELSRSSGQFVVRYGLWPRIRERRLPFDEVEHLATERTRPFSRPYPDLRFAVLPKHLAVAVLKSGKVQPLAIGEGPTYALDAAWQIRCLTGLMSRAPSPQGYW